MEKCYQHWTGRVTRLLPTQPWCGLYLKEGDLVELDHFIPRRPPFHGTYTISNLRAYHHHCHHQKTKLEAQRNAEPERSFVPNDNGLVDDAPDA